MQIHVSILAVLMAMSAVPALAQEAPCRSSGPFEPWLVHVKQEAAAAGVSQRTLAAAAPYLVYDQGIVNRDRGQRVFGQAFIEFSDRMAAAYRMQQSQARLKSHAAAFARAEQQYGVPGPVIAAFWGLESDFGVNQGKLPTLTSLATLAYDCRRAAMFREELIAALKVVERGDLSPGQMIGSWAGELGQTQFLATLYEKYAVDGDGDGRRDMLHSPTDVILSTANYIASLGWRRGEPWLQEVRVSAAVPWQEADLTIQHPRAQWAKWGVTLADGRALHADGLPASLLLPMGRNGPAFLAYNNFRIYTSWNNSLIYATTAAYLATRIAGAPPLRRPAAPIAQLGFNELKEMQQLLARQGFNVGKIDGILGQQSRVAVKTMQVKYSLPADSWPTAELLARLRGGGR
ncbi:MAG: lytic murein transglycosylase [Xanthobacteraceae bacterium]|nr:MAG: lytic murein transglycosylase [Xanthobacteraceae bacterium]